MIESIRRRKESPQICLLLKLSVDFVLTRIIEREPQSIGADKANLGGLLFSRIVKLCKQETSFKFQAPASPAEADKKQLLVLDYDFANKN